MKSAFTTELQSVEVSKVRSVCLPREFMNINEASKWLAVMEIAAISSYFECNKHSAVHAGVPGFPEVR